MGHSSITPNWSSGLVLVHPYSPLPLKPGQSRRRKRISAKLMDPSSTALLRIPRPSSHYSARGRILPAQATEEAAELAGNSAKQRWLRNGRLVHAASELGEQSTRRRLLAVPGATDRWSRGLPRGFQGLLGARRPGHRDREGRGRQPGQGAGRGTWRRGCPEPHRAEPACAAPRPGRTQRADERRPAEGPSATPAAPPPLSAPLARPPRPHPPPGRPRPARYPGE